MDPRTRKPPCLSRMRCVSKTLVAITILVTVAWWLRVQDFTFIKQVQLRIPSITLFSHTNVTANDVGESRIYLKTAGRLGNVLFQYSALYGISMMANGTGILHTDINIRDIFDNISENVSIKVNTKMDLGHPIKRQETQPGIFSPALVDNIPSGTVLICCYFESYKYFWHVAEDLRRQFVFKEDIQKQAQDILRDAARALASHVTSGSPPTFIGIHVRHGDLAKKQYQDRGYVLPKPSYFSKAKEYYRSKYRNVIFVLATDDKRWSEDNLQDGDTYFSSSPDGTVDLCVMAACNHTITSVGTFSWWAGFLAGGDTVYYKDFLQEGSVIYPWYPPEDRFPPEWIPMTD